MSTLLVPQAVWPVGANSSRATSSNAKKQSGLFGNLFGSGDSDTSGQSSPTSGTGAGPPVIISPVASGKNSSVSATTTVTSTSNVDASGGGMPITLSNANIGGPLSLTLTDAGSINASFDFASKTISDANALVAGGVGSAFKFADNAFNTTVGAIGDQNMNALKFAAGVAQGYADSTSALIRDAAEERARSESAILTAINDNNGRSYALIQGTVQGLGNLVTSTVQNLRDDSAAALQFFGTQSANLSNATIKAIDTVALRTSSEQAQGFDKVQDTFLKVGGALVVAIIAVAIFMGRK